MAQNEMGLRRCTFRTTSMGAIRSLLSTFVRSCMWLRSSSVGLFTKVNRPSRSMKPGSRLGLPVGAQVPYFLASRVGLVPPNWIDSERGIGHLGHFQLLRG